MWTISANEELSAFITPSYRMWSVADIFIQEKSTYVSHRSYCNGAEISKFSEILEELSMHKQCVPGSFLSTYSQEPGYEDSMYSD